MKQVVYSSSAMFALLSLIGCGGGSGGGGETISRIVYSAEDPLSKNVDLYSIRPDGTGKTLLGTTSETGFDASY